MPEHSWAKSEVRRSKAERRPKSEGRNPNRPRYPVVVFGFRPSFGLRPSPLPLLLAATGCCQPSGLASVAVGRMSNLQRQVGDLPHVPGRPASPADTVPALFWRTKDKTMNLNLAVQKPRMSRISRMTRMGTGFVRVENLFRGHPPGEHPWHRIPSLSVLSAKSVVPTAVSGMNPILQSIGRLPQIALPLNPPPSLRNPH